MTRKYYVYYLRDPRTNEVKLVGSTNGCKQRLWRHCNPTEVEKVANPRLVNWVMSLKPIRPVMQCLCVVGSKEDAIYFEQQLTRRLRARGVAIFNKMDGRAWTKEMIERASASGFKAHVEGKHAGHSERMKKLHASGTYADVNRSALTQATWDEGRRKRPTLKEIIQKGGTK